MVNRWEEYLKVSDWESDYPSVNNLLRHLRYRKIGSESSRCIYGNALYAFCMYTGKLPDELVALKKIDVEKLVEDFCYHKMDHGWKSPRTANTALFMLKTFFKVNGFKGNEKLEVESYHQPARARTRDEYIPTLEEARRMANVAGSLRNRAMILFMLSTGLRNSTLRAVLYGEVKEELEKNTPNILIKVHADMKKIVSSACKGNIEYTVFASQEATEAIRLYIGERRRRLGEIQDKELLFCSEHNRLPLRQRGSKPLTSRELQIIVKEAARKAGIKEWMNVVPHCLRKTFESVLRSRLEDGSRLDVKTQEYFMGHILAGSMDTYYDKSKVDEMRKEYGKLIFAPGREERASTLSSLQVVAEALGIDFAQPAESKKRELGRDLIGEEKLQLLQEVMKQFIRQFRDPTKCAAKLPSMDGSSEGNQSIQGSVGQTLLFCRYKQRAGNGLLENPLIEPAPNTISFEGNKQTYINPPTENNEIKSKQLTLFMMPREGTSRIESPVSGRQQLEPKSKVKNDLLSFLQSTN